MSSSSDFNAARGRRSAPAIGKASATGQPVAVPPLWLIALAAAVLAMTPDIQAAVSSASVEIATPHPAADGRLGLVITGNRSHSGGSPVQIKAVRIEGEQVEIVLASSFGPLPMFSGYTVSLMIDGLEPGDYQGRVLAVPTLESSEEREVGEFSFSVVDMHPDSLTVSYRRWPADPTVFDHVWALVDPIRTCSETELTEEAFLVVDEVPADCPPDALPRSVMLDFGTFGPGLTHCSFEYRMEGEHITQASLPFRVHDRLTSRMSGSWYNPAESGHGISLEVIGPDLLLVYWYTFDPAGDPLWLIAMGEYHGQGLASLQAERVSGGLFPPSFDPGQIELHHWGELEIEFDDCSRATLRWLPDDPAYSDGEMPLERLTRNLGHDCVGPPPESAQTPEWFDQDHWHYYHRVADDSLHPSPLG